MANAHYVNKPPAHTTPGSGVASVYHDTEATRNKLEGNAKTIRNLQRRVVELSHPAATISELRDTITDRNAALEAHTKTVQDQMETIDEQDKRIAQQAVEIQALCQKIDDCDSFIELYENITNSHETTVRVLRAKIQELRSLADELTPQVTCRKGPGCGTGG